MNATECFLCRALEQDTREVIVLRRRSLAAVMDRYPLAPGHLMIFPTEHGPDFFDLPLPTYLEVMELAAVIAPALKLHFSIAKIGVFFAGKEATEHTHLHMVPLEVGLKKLFEGLSQRPRREADLARLRLVASGIRRHIPESQLKEVL